ncbi:MAG: hypothetical protein PHY30_02925 [Candidatus Pacebacteria bacterium]|nr:hypothetical protein [Candidatus Paceibacterota bacterium]
MRTKTEIFKRYLTQYLKSEKQGKKAILDTVCEVTKFHRKAAIRKFKRLQMKSDSDEDRRGRPVVYGQETIAALKTVWEAASEICGELLHSVIPDYVSIIKRDKQWTYGDRATEKLLQMSEGTVKAKVGRFMKERSKRKGISATSPSALKNVIPIITHEWSNMPPGYGQIDTVVHCGSSLVGDMAFSLNYTDIDLWIGLSAQWNKGQIATMNSLESIKERLPF